MFGSFRGIGGNRKKGRVIATRPFDKKLLLKYKIAGVLLGMVGLLFNEEQPEGRSSL